MQKSSPYTWIREEDDQGNFTYSFWNYNNIAYTAEFNPTSYIQYMADFPVLLLNGYEFGFSRKPNTSKERDYRVIQTIHNIVLDFLDKQPNDVIVLYFCQPSNDNSEQRQREMLFERTYNSSPRRNEIVKNTLEIEVPVNDKIDPHFVGFFTKASNPNLQAAINELDDFAMRIATGHIEK